MQTIDDKISQYLKNYSEYFPLSGNLLLAHEGEVIHHSTFLQQLINEGKVGLKGGGEFKGKKITP